MASTAKNTCFAHVVLAFGLAGMPANSQDLAMSLGKQRAASSRLQWEIRETTHPILGPIRFAFPKSPIATQVGISKVSSRVYVSCERSSGKIAIELANATAADDPGGLQPKTMPRLVCNKPSASGDRKLVQDELDARWAISDIGDVLARGLQPPLLRECVSIGIVQEVALPKGWARDSVQVEFEITPYSRELDSIFVTCGAVSAYAPVAPATSPASAKLATPPRSAESPASAISATPPRSTEASWKTARTTSSGKTNVRARPALDAAVVAQLDPGAIVLVQQTGGEWWRARSSAGAAFEGYIRQDRLVFK